MITGVHAIVYNSEPEKLRAWFRDVLALPPVDASEGWPIFVLPPSELAVHPLDGGTGHHELFLMTDDINATVRDLTAKGVEFAAPITDQRWGLLTAIKIPGGGELGLYEPRHPTAINLTANH